MCSVCNDLRAKRDNATTARERELYQTVLDGHQANTCAENRNAAAYRAMIEQEREERNKPGLFRWGRNQ